jgi:hypothetical protein
MASRCSSRSLRTAGLAVAVIAVAGLAASPFLVRECDVCEAATSIFLSGYVAGKCTIDVTPDTQAVNLTIDTASPQRVLIGSVLQDCNGTRSYAISVTSWNCAAAPTGGKLLADGTDDYLPYTVEFNNPTSGGSQAVVANLLASSCTGQIARGVTSHNVNNETSTVYLNFTGSSDLEAGTYEDVVTISITMM